MARAYVKGDEGKRRLGCGRTGKRSVYGWCIPIPERAVRDWRRKKKMKKSSISLISSHCRMCLSLQLSKVILFVLNAFLMSYNYGELLNWRLREVNEWINHCLWRRSTSLHRVPIREHGVGLLYRVLERKWDSVVSGDLVHFGAPSVV